MTQDSIIRLFSLNTSSGIPIYRQLVDQVKQAIRINLLKENQQLPSVRQLASNLQINPMTISKAFAQLELEGFLIRKRGVGMLVAEMADNDSLDSSVENNLQLFIQQAREKQMTDEQILSTVQQYLSIQLKN